MLNPWEAFMHKSVQILVAIACIVVIAGAGCWAIDRRAAQKAAEQQAQFLIDADRGWRLAECRALVREFDSGNSARAEAKFGTAASDGVDACRNLITIDEIRKSTPSE